MAESLSTLGWPVRRVGMSTFLSTTSGICGVEVNKQLGHEMLAILRDMDAHGPVACFSRPRRTYIFLAEADVVLDPRPLARLGAGLLTAPAVIPLPPSETKQGRLYWIVPPTTHRWLPSLSTLRWALTSASARSEDRIVRS
jgi:hypothetical protein